MPVWDDMVVGQPIIGAANFSESSGYTADFTQPLDEIFGTEAGLGTTDGQLLPGGVDSGLQAYATIPGSNNNQINGEQQVYYGPNSPVSDPLVAFEKRGTSLAIKSWLATTADEDAHYVGYHILPNGEFATGADFTAENGFPAGVPTDWGDVITEDGDVKLFTKRPARFVSGAFNTEGRFGASFFRVSCVCEAPTGGRDRSNTPPRDQSVSDEYGLVQPHNIGADIDDVDAQFPAVPWTLQYKKKGADINGEPNADGETHTPGNQAAKGQRPELDGMEVFGDSSTDIQQTMHYYEQGYTDASGQPAQIISKESPPPTVENVRLANEYGKDVTPGKIGWWIRKAGETVAYYTRVVDTPASIADPLPVYEKDPDIDYLPLMNGNSASIIGQQQHASGDPRYMYHAIYCTYARNGKFVRDFVFDKATHHDEYYRATLPDYTDYDELIIHSLYMWPLAVDNPDAFPTIVNNIPTALIDDEVVTSTPEIDSFEDTFRFRVSYMSDQYVGAPVNVRAEVLENPVGYPYKFEISIDESRIPAGVNITVEQGGSNQASIYCDTAVDLDDMIIVTATQDGEAPA